ncbi:aspartyl-phosphate phosphatase Spo0E family protein [Neobacillus mesonae]|uniref:aspartyl-phosphate phosphatase Spo0E family protein n=1 Tax=Neobacillus mesonae TaxID=1193713 RepID=UPI002041A2C1|nr:aspartyl-phosphate phosphatase Spo0E family protein [Neobacillus mesonae]MCM3569228.1 aspartyl-phosphate phosphatase Spo0E family protein [Neobacillus mesonae]
MISTNILKNIATVRKNMISAGMSKGFTSPETIKLSQTLDKLMNQQMNRLNQNVKTK